MKVAAILNKLKLELQTAGITSAAIDSQILVEFVSAKSREFLLTNPDFQLSKTEIKQLAELTKRRKKSEPIAYLVKKKEFFELDFFVDKQVLIPRPETELLVEKALDFLKTKNQKQARILDIGTGSGNIIISIAKNTQGKFFASDISAQALVVAKKNAKKHQVDIKFIHSNLFEKITGKYDLIVANLPYVPSSDNPEIKYEPKEAIFAADNGTKIIKQLILQAKKYLYKGGLLLIEADPRNIDQLKRIAKKRFSKVAIYKDYSRQKRGLEILV